MRLRVLVGVATAVLTIQSAPVAAQKTGDQSRLVFTISGAYITGQGLWTIPNQPIFVDGLTPDTLFLSRSIANNFGAGFSASYFKGSHFGLTGDAFLLGLGYEDRCHLASPQLDAQNSRICADIDDQNKSAAAVAISVGAIVRVASREFISPFARVGAGVLFNNQSSVFMSGFDPQDGALHVVYNDDRTTRVRPNFEIGVGTTVAVSRGYHLRFEVRDNFVGVVRVNEPLPNVGAIPPHGTTYRQLWSLLVGVDVILERVRGRRY
jgi:opacity protein-like surface antigen